MERIISFNLELSRLSPVCLTSPPGKLRSWLSLERISTYSSLAKSRDRGQGATGWGGSKGIICASGVPGLLTSWHLSLKPG